MCTAVPRITHLFTWKLCSRFQHAQKIAEKCTIKFHETQKHFRMWIYQVHVQYIIKSNQILLWMLAYTTVSFLFAVA